MYKPMLKPSRGGLAQLARAPALQAGGQRFESVILHHRKVRSLKYWDKQDCSINNAAESMYLCAARRFSEALSGRRKEVYKGAWWMPRLTEAMKDVISCDKPRVGANSL